jgi:hypothetical protein
MYATRDPQATTATAIIDDAATALAAPAWTWLGLLPALFPIPPVCEMIDEVDDDRVDAEVLLAIEDDEDDVDVKVVRAEYDDKVGAGPAKG